MSDAASRLKKKLDSDEDLKKRDVHKYRDAIRESISETDKAGFSLEREDDDKSDAIRMRRFGMKDTDMRKRDLTRSYPKNSQTKDDIKFDIKEFVEEPEFHAERGEDSVKVESAAKKYAKLRDMMGKKKAK